MSMKKYLAICFVFLLVVSVFGSIGGYSNSTDEDRFSGLEQQETLTSELGIDSSDDPTMYVLVNSTIYEPLDDELTRYKEDVEDTEDLEVEIIENTYTDPSEIRNFLQDGYENDGLVGVFLVGNLHYAEFEISDHPGYPDGYSRFPIDHYYTDLDGTWEDTNNSGVYDEHLPGDGDLDPEIWLGRISMKTDWADEIELYKNYFEKIYQYRRGNLSVEDKSLLYIDDDWIPWTDDYKQGLLRLYDDDNVTLINDPEDTTADDYSERVQEGYEWIQIHCHANESAKRHAFRYQGGPKGSGGNFTSEDLYEDGHNSLFQNVFTCGSADYTVPNYLCGWYALAEDHGLANVGSSQAGSMLEFENYYEPLSYGSTLGEAMQEWWIDTVEDDFDSRVWFYGMTTIGDPTLSVVDEDELEEYELTVEIEGEGEVEADPHREKYFEGMEVDLKAVPEDSWGFMEWTGDHESSEEEITIVMDENKSLTAHFREVEYEISDWEDLHNMRYDLEGEYTLMNNLDEDTDGYEELASEEANKEDEFDENLGSPRRNDAGERFELSYTPLAEILVSEDADDGSEVEVEIIDAEKGIIELKEDTDGFLYVEYRTVDEIALGWEPIEDFVGTFDGGDHEIKDLYIFRPGETMVGFIGSTRSQAEIKEVNVINVRVSGDRGVGGLVGYNVEGTIDNSHVTGTVNGEVGLGGLVGENHVGGTIVNSHAACDVSGEDYVGGLIGRNLATVENSYATGTVSGTNYVGGLLGINGDFSIVKNSYAEADVSGEESVGGLVGFNFRGTVENSHYNIDEVEINGKHYITRGGLFEEQFDDWIEEKELDIDDYSETLVPSDDHYEIEGIQGIKDLLGFACREEYEFRLSDDIDLSDETNLYIPYLRADFDGNHHTISNLQLDLPFALPVGMFGQLDGLDGGVEISNVSVIEAKVNGVNHVGALVGYNHYGTVKNSSVSGDVSGEQFIGGLVGSNRHGTIFASYATGDVSGESIIVGGLVGRNWLGTIFGSYATGNVSGGDQTGGLAGDNMGGTVKNSYVTGEVDGEDAIGGMIGRNSGKVSNSYVTGDVSGTRSVGGLIGSNRGKVNNSYATGDVSGDNRVGGLVGSKVGGTVENSYATGDVSGNENVGGLIGWNMEATVEKSFATGDVDGHRNVGGLIGENRQTSGNIFVSESYALGGVSGDENVGGLVGLNSGFIKNSYSVGYVVGEENVGGLVGYQVEREDIDIGVTENSFWDIENSEQNESDGGTGKTTAEMKDVATYTDTYTEGLEDPWDFVGDPYDDEGDEDIWDIDEQGLTNDGYPYLKEITEEVVGYELTVEIDGEGTVDLDPDDGIYKEGTEVTLTATPDDSWEFDEWTGDLPDDEEGEEITIIMDGDKEITAHFEEEEDDDIPGFTSLTLVLGVMIAVAIYQKKKEWR